MSKDEQQFQTAGGTLGKLAGRAKQIVGSALGRDDLDREGRLQQVQAETEEDVARRSEEAAGREAEAKLAAERAETEERRRRLEAEVSETRVEETIEHDQAQAESTAERAARERTAAAGAAQHAAESMAARTEQNADTDHDRESREAAALEREADRAEALADAIDPKENNS